MADTSHDASKLTLPVVLGAVLVMLFVAPRLVWPAAALGAVGCGVFFVRAVLAHARARGVERARAALGSTLDGRLARLALVVGAAAIALVVGAVAWGAAAWLGSAAPATAGAVGFLAVAAAGGLWLLALPEVDREASPTPSAIRLWWASAPRPVPAETETTDDDDDDDDEEDEIVDWDVLTDEEREELETARILDYMDWPESIPRPPTAAEAAAARERDQAWLAASRAEDTAAREAHRVTWAGFAAWCQSHRVDPSELKADFDRHSGSGYRRAATPADATAYVQELALADGWIAPYERDPGTYKYLDDWLDDLPPEGAGAAAVALAKAEPVELGARLVEVSATWARSQDAHVRLQRAMGFDVGPDVTLV